ncbi:unnamed protein product [Cochlearia groenlandica]
MSKKKMKEFTSTKDNGSSRYRNGVVKESLFDKIDYEVSSILLQLSHPVVFSCDYYSPLLHKWGRTKKRSTLVFQNPAKKISPEPVSTEIAGTDNNSSSSCLTGEANKTNFNTGLIGAQVGFQAQPSMYFDRTANMRDSVGTRGFDLNLPASSMVDFQRAEAAQARQRRLTLIRSKKLYKNTRFIISPHQNN